ncbi:hypothetical protein DL98DRAFT_536434 [Cadophora sp. DSE1049]|nr:hypothetical protein DL98DRAFT_536434 [Cadophora sp. DSE1049]
MASSHRPSRRSFSVNAALAEDRMAMVVVNNSPDIWLSCVVLLKSLKEFKRGPLQATMAERAPSETAPPSDFTLSPSIQTPRFEYLFSTSRDMAGTAINIIVLGLTGISSIPALTSFFAAPVPEQILVNIGVGATNSEILPDGNPAGKAPSASVFDVNGNLLGFASGADTTIADGGSLKLSIGGEEGGLTSITPNYPSTAQFPGLTTSYKPPCFWMSNDGRFPKGFSARLSDFFFPGSSGPANETATQWTEFPDTLCHAPARQQFYKETGDCIPFYPSGLDVVNQKDEQGFDVDFIAIETSHTITCSNAGVPWNRDVQLEATPVPATQPSANPALTIPPGVTLQSSLNLGHLRRTPQTTSSGEPPHITAAPIPKHQPKSQPKVELSKKNPIINRQIEKRAERPHEWCEENQLVISEDTGHSAVEVCESLSSWGPDFVSVQEGIFCDMCLRKTYPLCGGGGGATRTCFDLEKKQLIALARVRRSEGVPVKRYVSVRHWK